MPRDGSGIYNQPFPDVVEGTTIESAVYNGFTNDVAQDLNAPRPIIAGGTGGSSAYDARDNLDAEVSGAQVTSYDSHIFENGSFWSAASATGSPVSGHTFAGISYGKDANSVILEVRDLEPELSVPLWLNTTLYHVGVRVRDAADNSVWKSTAEQVTGAAPMTFAEYRTATSGLLWANDTSGQITRYIREKKLGVWSAWYSDTTVKAIRYDAAQILTAGEQAQARKNVYAAPFDALAYNGMQINGSMEVSQERGSSILVLTPPMGLSAIDGWVATAVGSGQCQAYQSTEVPNRGFSKSLGFASTGTPPTGGASDYDYLWQPIEGIRWGRLGWGASGAQPVTLAFWVFSDTAGAMGVAVKSGTSPDRTYVVLVNVVAGAWAYKTVTIPGDISGTWPSDNTRGAIISFCANCTNPSFLTSPNTWQAGNFLSAAGQSNLVSSPNKGIKITGVVVLPGIEAPSAERSALIMRPYDQELVTCQRYFNCWGTSSPQAVGFGYSISATQAMILMDYPCEMRASPTLNFNSTNWTLVNHVNSNCSISSTAINAVNPKNMMILFGSPSGLAVGGPCRLQTTGAVTPLYVDARL